VVISILGRRSKTKLCQSPPDSLALLDPVSLANFSYPLRERFQHFLIPLALLSLYKAQPILFLGGADILRNVLPPRVSHSPCLVLHIMMWSPSETFPQPLRRPSSPPGRLDIFPYCRFLPFFPSLQQTTFFMRNPETALRPLTIYKASYVSHKLFFTCSNNFPLPPPLYLN